MLLALLIIFAVGLSRMYLGVHYFSDVSAGIFLGIAWASFIGGIGTFLERRNQ
jgi:undecaprenyl-diphosphatase